MSDNPFIETETVDDLTTLANENAEAMQSLASQGGVLDPTELLSLRLEVAIEFLLHDGGQARYAFEMLFHSNLSNVLAEADKNLREQKLLQGVDKPPTDLRSV